MMEITNKTRGPVSLVVKSFSPRREHTKALTSYSIPALKTIKIADERVVNIYLERLKKDKLISYKYIPNSKFEVTQQE